MDTKLLRHFQILAKVCHLRKAAQLIGMSHAGLHKAMRRLEDECGEELFFSTGRELQISPYGQELLQKIPDFLYHEEKLLHKNKIQNNSIIRMGSFEIFSTYFLHQIFSQQKNIFDKILLKELLPGELEQALINNMIDFGITYFPVATHNLEFSAITKITMGVWAKRGSFTNITLNNLPFIAPAPVLSNIYTGVGELDDWPANLYRKINFRVDLLESALELARLGLGAIFVPNFIAKFSNLKYKKEFELEQLTFFQEQDIIQKQVYIIRRKNQKENILEKKIARAIRTLIN